MKTINLYGLLLFSATLLINSGCTEDDNIYNVTPINTLPTTQNIKLNVSAGDDIQVILSSDSKFLILSGYYIARGIQGEIINLNNAKIQWKKKSGPSSYKLENPNSIKTKVSNLEKGIYEFELTVTNTNGLTGKDTVRVIVGEISENSKEIIFKDRKWIFPWYSTIEIKDFNLLIPQNSFKVYIQRENNSQWEEVASILENAGIKYEYFVETRPDGGGMYTYGSLYIFYYGTNTNDTPSVKIVY